MDLVWNLSTTEDGKVEMELRPSSFVCPLAPDLSQEIRHGLREIEGVKSIRVEVADCLRADEINEAFREEETQEQRSTLDRIVSSVWLTATKTQ